MLDVTDPRLNEAGGLSNLHLTQTALIPNSPDSLSQGVGIGSR
jgi:hypothetical protein